MYKRTENDDLAIANFEKAYAIDSNDMDTVKDLAFCYHKKGDYVNAVKYYDVALKNDTDNYSLNYNRAIAIHAQDKYEEAIAAYEKVLSLKDDEVIKTNLNAALIEYGFKLNNDAKYADARVNFEKAIKMNPKESSAYMGMAIAYQKEQNYAQAMSYYQKATDLAPKN